MTKSMPSNCFSHGIPSISRQRDFKQIISHCFHKIKLKSPWLFKRLFPSALSGINTTWFHDFRHVLSRSGCTVSPWYQNLASRSGNTACKNPVEAGWQNCFILSCVITHVTEEKCIRLLFSPLAKKEGCHASLRPSHDPRSRITHMMVY